MKKNARLKDGIFLTRGFKYSIIYDGNKNELYQVDREAYDWMTKFLAGNCQIEDNKQMERTLLDNGLIVYESQDKEQEQEKELNKVWIELRKSCNMSCLHCYNSSNPNAEKLDECMSTEQWKNVITQLIPYNPKSVILIGGEPLLYDDIIEIVAYTKKSLPKTIIVLYSNLTKLTNEILQCIKAYDVRVVTSIYGSVATIHDKITTVKGSFDRTVRNVKLLRKENVSVKANIVVMSINEDDIDNTKKFILDITGQEAGVDVVREVRDGIADLQPRKQKKKRIIRGLSAFSDASPERYVKNMKGNPCWQGKLNIGYDGSVTPCIMFQGKKNVLTLKKESLNNIIEKRVKRDFWGITKDKIEVCKDCEYRYLCSDCRPLASGDYKRSIKCLYNPYLGKWNVDEDMLDKFCDVPKVNANNRESDIAFVFSCPGQKEKQYNQLCSGQTGKNLERLIEKLNSAMPDIFRGKHKEDYFITNASNRVHYKALTNSTEPSRKELWIPENMYRLLDELRGRKIVICCGRNSQAIVSKLSLDAQVINVCHLGNVGLSNTYRGIKGTEAKLNEVAREIVVSIEQKKQ